MRYKIVNNTNFLKSLCTLQCDILSKYCVFFTEQFCKIKKCRYIRGYRFAAFSHSTTTDYLDSFPYKNRDYPIRGYIFSVTFQ